MSKTPAVGSRNISTSRRKCSKFVSRVEKEEYLVEIFLFFPHVGKKVFLLFYL
jgi:hypothetical protein